MILYKVWSDGWNLEIIIELKRFGKLGINSRFASSSSILMI